MFAVAGSFGWGSVGKLALILAELSEIEIIGIGEFSADLATRVSRYAQMSDIPDLLATGSSKAALVIGAPGAVKDLQALGVQVFFVDSLPYLWTVNDDIAVTADCYFAQQCTVVPNLAWPALRAIRALEWIDAIVPPVNPVKKKIRPSPGRTAVINVGGLHSPFSGDAADAYTEAVIPATIRAVESAGFTIIGVCGNISSKIMSQVEDASKTKLPHIGPLPHAKFSTLLSDADLVVTSPGSTTILQAYAAGKTPLLLPPQNVSQVLNVKQFGMGWESDSAVAWPLEIFDERHFESVRGAGEEVAVTALYDASRRASKSSSAKKYIEDHVYKLTLGASDSEVVNSYLRLVGTNGARQVADEIRRRISV